MHRRALATDRAARGVAVVAAPALGGGLLVTSRLGLDRVGGLDAGVFGFLYLVAPAAVTAVAALVALTRGSLGSGVQAAVWTTLLGSLAMFAVAVPEAVTWYRELSGLILAGDGIPLRAVGENLRNFIWMLVLLPFWWLPFGLLGASLGRGARCLATGVLRWSWLVLASPG